MADLPVLAVVTAVLAAVLWFALRHARPVGAVLEPWPYVLRLDARTRFERSLPEPGETICGATPPRDVLRELYPRSITACYFHPHPRLPGIAHVGMLADRDPGPFGWWSSYTWVEPGGRPTPELRRRRPAWWRRALVRLAGA